MLSLVQRYSRSGCVLADIVTCNAIEVCRDLLSESQGERSIPVSGRYDAAAMDVSYNIHEAVSRPSAYPPKRPCRYGMTAQATEVARSVN